MISILNGGSRKELCPRSKLPALTAFRVIPIRTKYPRALSSCIMHTHRRWKQPPHLPWARFSAPCRREAAAPLSRPLPTASPTLPSSPPDRVFRVILLCCDSIVAPTAYTVSMLRMLAFLPHARKHTSAYEARAEILRTIHTHTPTHVHTYTDIYIPGRSWGERCVCRYTEYLALSIQRKGITYYRRLPARRALIYCYPVRISCGKKRIPASPSRQQSPRLPPLTLRWSALYIRKIIVRFNNVSFRRTRLTSFAAFI